MKIFTHTGGVFATNAYLVADERTGQAIVFDAPNDTTGPLLDIVVKNEWTLCGLWLTHGHIDHIADHAAVTARFPNARILMHPLDQSKLQNPMSIFPLPFQTPGRSADAMLSDNQQLKIGSIEVNVIHTPGHSPGHVMFHFPKEKILIGGDVIIMNAVGRTDFPDCSYPDLQSSIRRIMQLPGDTQLLPGHGPPSTLDDERHSNPYVQQALAAKKV